MKNWKTKEDYFTTWLSEQGLWRAVKKSRALRGERVEDIEWGPFSVEVKTRSKIPQYVRGWMKQAQTNSQSRLPILIWHQDHMSGGSQLVVLTLDNFVHMLAQLTSERGFDERDEEVFDREFDSLTGCGDDPL